MNKNKILFFIGIAIYLASFFMPTLQFSLGVKLLGWESMLLQYSEILIITTASDYFKYIFAMLSNFWVIGLIIGWFIPQNKIITLVLSVLAISSSLIWLFVFVNNSVILNGYYVWLLSIMLIITSRIIKK